MIIRPGQGGNLARFFGWLTLTHTQRWHATDTPPGHNGS
jgi:hypothetical protein